MYGRLTWLLISLGTHVASYCVMAYCTVTGDGQLTKIFEHFEIKKYS